MPLTAGARLGPYEIVSAIGKGGMGEVWKARDPRLERCVAIKISAQQFTDRLSAKPAPLQPPKERYSLRLILSGFLYMIDDKDFHGPSCRLQFQPELVL